MIDQYFLQGMNVSMLHIYFILGLIFLKAMTMYVIQVITQHISKVYTLKLREKFYQKMLDISEVELEKMSSTNFLVLYSEGIKKIATFVSKSVPFNYASLLNIVVIALCLDFIHWLLGVSLLIAACLIPFGMYLVRGAAKKIVSDKWKSYVNLSENFLDNLTGLTVLKTYQSDRYKHEQMNSLAEDFRVKTMKSLSFRLHSITIMEIVTYVGMGLLMTLSVVLNQIEQITTINMMFVLLMASMLLIPARQLGTYAHSYRSAKKKYKTFDAKDQV